MISFGQCYFLVALVAQSCPTLFDRVDCSLPGSSVHGILQARILEGVGISFSIPNPGIEPGSPALHFLIRHKYYHHHFKDEENKAWQVHTAVVPLEQDRVKPSCLVVPGLTLFLSRHYSEPSILKTLC